MRKELLVQDRYISPHSKDLVRQRCDEIAQKRAPKYRRALYRHHGQDPEESDDDDV